MNCQGYPVEDYGLYVLNELEEPQATAIRDHLADDCNTCRREVGLSSTLWYLTAVAVADEVAAEPSAGLRRRVLRTAQPTSPPASNKLRWIWAPAFAAAAALILVTIWGVNRFGPAASSTAELDRQRSLLAQAQQSERQWQDRAQAAERELGAVRSQAPPAERPVNTLPSVAPKSDLSDEVARARAEIQSLTDSLARERAQETALSAELNSQKSLLASTLQQRDDAEKRAQSAGDDRTRRTELEARVASLNTRVQQLTRENSNYRESVDALARQIDKNTRLVSFLSSDNLKTVRLQSTEAGATASGQAFIVDGQKVVFYASGLPRLAPGKAYQLWLLRAKSPAIVSGGVFRSDGQRQSIEFSDPSLVKDIRGVAVTEEPEGGSPGPTGHKYLVGTAKS